MDIEERLDDHFDPRATLGVRPGARPGQSRRPLPQLQLQLTPSADSTTSSRPPSPRNTNARISLNTANLDSSPTRFVSAATALSHATSNTSTDASTSPTANLGRRLRRPTLSRKHNAAELTANRGQYETQKLLQHLLDRLESRRKGPDLLNRAIAATKSANLSGGKHGVAHISKAVAAATVRTTAAAGKALTRGDDEKDDDDYDDHPAADTDWDTDATYDLLEQTRDLLILAAKQGLDIFGDCGVSAASAARKAAKGKNKSRVAGRFSSISGAIAKDDANNDDNVFGDGITGSSLLKRLAVVVQSLIATDCIHTTLRFRLIKPPYALQSIVLDVAALLYHKGDLEIKLMMMNAVIDGFYTMGAPMRDRICQWLEGRMGELLRKLAHEREGIADEDEPVFQDPFAISPITTEVSSTVPTFAFSAPDDPVQTPVKTKGWMRYSPANTPTVSPKAKKFKWPDNIVGVLSTHATSNVSSAAVQIGALVPRMLVALTSTVDLTTSNLTTIHSVHRLISLILTAKPDTGIDVLELVAHGPPVSRRRGMDILATYYANTVGHNIIARRPALTTYVAHRAKWETGQDRALQEDDTQGHYYIPWRADLSKDLCTHCETRCLGFCVKCTLCSDLKHFNCLETPYLEKFQYEVTILATQNVPSRVETVGLRFSLVPPRADELVINGGATKGTIEATERNIGQHRLHLVNLFTLTLCDECRQPLWGTTCQAYACLNKCQRFFHPACVDAMSFYKDPACHPGHLVYVNPEATDSNQILDPFTTTGMLIHESFNQFKNKLCYDPSTLTAMSYDEVAYLYANVWLQHEIYLNGISVGSLRLLDVPLEDDITGIALLLNQYEVKLTGNLQPSPAMIDFANVATGGDIPDRGCLLWHERYLQYCAALIRAPPDPSHNGANSSGGLLTVDGLPGIPDPAAAESESTPLAYEQVPMRVVQQCLGSDLQLRDDLAVSTLMEQLRSLGLITVPNKRIVDIAAVDDPATQVITPLPLLIDSSPAVELLVLAIEGLLEDIDLTANEQAMSMLIKLAWPTPMCSPYAMLRLGGAVMSWIMDEDDVLHHIVKNYASKRKRPPGVRNPPGMTSAGGGTTAVAAYKDDRGRLLRHYARPWLEALCNLDSDEYTELAYDRSKQIDNRYEVLDLPKGDEAAARIAGIALEKITALADADVMFNGSLDLLTMWLEDLGTIVDGDFVFKPLPRLLRHANGREWSTDIWVRADEISEQNPDGFGRVCRWFRALTFSGVVVPWSAILNMVDRHSVGRSMDESLFDLVVAVDANSAPSESDAFAQLCNNIFIPLAVSMGMRTEKPSPKDVEMLRISMLSLLKAYGTPAEAIAETSLTSEGHANVLASNTKRKQSTVVPLLEHRLVQMHPEVIFAAARILQREDNPAELVLDFLWLVFSKATGVDNIKGFIHHIAADLYEILWPLYDRHDLNRRSRARVFLTLLTINSQPIEDIVTNGLNGGQTAVTRERLLEFVLELADDTLGVEVDGWRRASVSLITIFFNHALQPLEPCPESLVIWKALLPTQLAAITACFEEYLEICPDEQRLLLIVQLLRLRALLPAWPIIGWPIIEQLVSEQVSCIEQFQDIDSVQAQAAVTEARNIRAAILALGLQMLSAGVQCEWMTLQRFQQHVAAACAQPWLQSSDTITGILLPALKTVLDSTSRTSILDSNGRLKETTLVGALFVAIVINFANDLHQHDFIVQRCIIDILLVVFFKHNVQPYELSALSTLQTLSAFAAGENPSENRLLALHVLRTAQARMSNERFSRVLPPLFVRAADIMFKEIKAKGDSAIIDSCRQFLQASIEEFGKAGLFLQVLRTDGQQNDGNSTAPEAIGRAMAVTTSLSGSKDKNVWLDQVILDLPEVLRWPREGMSQVFHSLSRLTVTLQSGLSSESALEFGAFLSRLGKQASEWDAPEGINLNLVLRTCTALLNICPASAALTLLHQVSHFLHTILPRYIVQLDQIRNLVEVSIRIARQQQTDNTVATVLFELCGAALKGLAMHPVTLKALIDWLADDEDTDLQTERLSILVDASVGCGMILTRAHPTIVDLHDAELSMGLLKGAATVIVRAEMQLEGNMGRVLQNLPNEAASIQLDVFAHILYASLDVRLGKARERLMSLYPVLGRATSLSLFACADLLSVPDASGNGAHLASAAFVVMRLAILAVNDPPPKDDTFDTSSVAAHDVLLSFWHRLWPEWERLLGLSLAPSCINLPQRAVTLSVLMDIILFISVNNPSLLVEPAPAIARGLANLEEWHHSAGTQIPAKLGKAVAALEAAALRAQPAANARRTAMSAVWADMLATERLFSLKFFND